MCLTRKTKRVKKKYKRRVYPEPIPDYTNIGSEIYECGFCKVSCSSDDIKIFCDGCEKFYCCHIAGSCVGEKCTYTLASGLTHSSRYCINCVNLNNSINTKYIGERCICKKCEPSFTN